MIKPKYFLYARKSSEDDDKQVMSIEAQLFELREFARKENLEILEEFQESKSAKKPGREKFSEMLSRIESMDGAGVFCCPHPKGGLFRLKVAWTKTIFIYKPSQKTSFFCPRPQKEEKPPFAG